MTPESRFDDPRTVASVHRVAISVMLVLGAIDTAYFRTWNVNPDGVSYINLAQAFAAHGPAALINGYWSLLYPGLLGTVIAAVRPDNESLFSVMRAVGFGVFAATTLAFAHLLRVVFDHGDFKQVPRQRLCVVIVAWLAYAVFVLKAIGLFLVTPDMGVAGIVFCASAELISITREPIPTRRWARFGAVLAISYWWKAILLPVAGVLLAIAGLVAARRRDNRRGPASAMIAFAVLALVVIVPVSQLAGRITFGESARLNQLWYVAGAPWIYEACGTTPNAGRPAMRPAPTIATTPLTCSMPDQWPESALPMWYDPSWWYRDTQTPVNIAATWTAVLRDVGYLREALGEAAPWLSAGLMIVLVAAIATRTTAAQTWPLYVTGAAAIMLYLVVYVELRHVVPFIMIAAVACLAGLAVRPARWASISLATLAVCGAVDVYEQLGEPLLVSMSILRSEVRGDPHTVPTSALVALRLREHGMAEGARFVTINALWNADWAVRGGYTVRAYTPEYTVPFTQTYRELDGACARAAWAARMTANHIDAALMRVPDPFRAPGGFERLEGTEFYLLIPSKVVAPSTCAPTRSATRSSS